MGAERPKRTIWFHDAVYWSRDHDQRIATLRLVLSSGLIDHVLIQPLHRRDPGGDLKDVRISHAVEVVREHPGVKLIFCRNLWPQEKAGQDHFYQYSEGHDVVPENIIQNARYYRDELLVLQAEARSLRADYRALDCEPYGVSIMKKVIKDKDWTNPSAPDLRLLTGIASAVREVTADIGLVPIVRPGGSLSRQHPYNELSRIGQWRICEHTYYNNPNIHKRIWYPWEIRGVWLETTKDNPNDKYPNDPEWCQPFYLVSDILTRPDLWRDNEGLYLRSHYNTQGVAAALVEFGKTDRGGDPDGRGLPVVH